MLDMNERPLPGYEGRRGLEGHQPKNEGDRQRGYTESKFAGHPYFKCCYCPFDNQEERETRLHVYKQHWIRPEAFLPETRPPQATLFDASGRMVESIPIQRGELLDAVVLSNEDEIIGLAFEDVLEDEI